MTRLDDWLDAAIHPSMRHDDEARFRHERFILARLATSLAAFAVLPVLLIWQGDLSGIGGAAFAVLFTPLVGVYLVSRFARLAEAQALVALSLIGFGIFASFAGSSAGGFAFLVAAFDGLFFKHAHRRSLVAIPSLLALAALIRMQGMQAPLDLGYGIGASLGIACAYAFGHAVAQVALDARLQKALAQVLKAGEARESATLQAIDDLVLWHDAQGGVLRANKAASAILGVPHSALKGHGFLHQIHVADRPAYLKAISDAAHGRNVCVAELRLPSKNAEGVAVVELRAQRIEGQDVVVAVARDISTHRHQVEEEQARAEAIANVFTVRAGLVAKICHEALGKLPALTRADVRRDQQVVKIPPFKHSDAEQTIRELLLHLLSLSLLESKKPELNVEGVEVAAFIDECRCDMSALAKQRNVVFTEDIAADLPDLVVDRAACHDILTHLAANVVEMTPSGGTVVLKARCQSDELILSVLCRDSSSADVEHSALRQFTLDRAHPQRMASVVGEVRLAFAGLLAERLGGRIAPEGHFGNGYGETLRLPLHRSAHPRPAEKARPSFTMHRRSQSGALNHQQGMT